MRCARALPIDAAWRCPSRAFLDAGSQQTYSQLAHHGKMSGFTFKVEAVEVERGKIFRHEVCSPSDSFSANHLKKSQHLEAFYLSSALPVPLNQQNRSYFDREFDHGLVHACLISFTQHKRLVLRPDDIFFPLVDAAAAHVLNQGMHAPSLHLITSIR